jgi:RND family efflux transporter MFP subunit
VTWSNASPSSQPAALTSWQRLADHWKTPELAALRATDRDNNTVAICLLAGSQAIDPQGECFLTLVGQVAGPLLKALQRGSLRQWLSSMYGHLPGWLTPWRAAGLGAVILATLLYPWPSHTSCSVVLEPQAQRLVAAPFEGVFNRSLVLPGDKVQAGEVLGEMEGRELRSRQAALEADLARSSKSRDANLAGGKFAAAQIDRLQSQRLEHELAVLEERLKKLEIKSPIDGIVVSGDLRRNEGAAVKVGQSLFEIAPLESVVAEIAVPEEDLEGVSLRAPVTLRLDAAPGRSWQGQIERVHPRGELRENKQVFIAEFVLANSSGELRPGMKGNASITGPRAPGLWQLIRKPINTARRFLGL